MKTYTELQLLFTSFELGLGGCIERFLYLLAWGSLKVLPNSSYQYSPGQITLTYMLFWLQGAESQFKLPEAKKSQIHDNIRGCLLHLFPLSWVSASFFSLAADYLSSHNRSMTTGISWVFQLTTLATCRETTSTLWVPSPRPMRNCLLAQLGPQAFF